MQLKEKSVIILYAEDDEEYRLLMQDAFQKSHIIKELHFVKDGEELMNYLNRRDKYKCLKGTPLPGIILLDLEMSRKDGREVTREIKTTPRLRRIPIVVLVTSKAEKDIIHSYQSGVNSVIKKPATFESLVHIIKTLSKYWFEIVELPKTD